MGLSHMFQMINESRISVGIGATATASAAFQAALDYTRQRRQGRLPGEKDASLPPVPIIEHADVKRMLLYQKSITEGALCLLLHGAKSADLAHVSTGDEKNRLEHLLNILVPVFKAYPSEKGILSTSQALQCFGGYGYCEDFPVEQHYRDIRIHPLHEGTTGIQAIDLLGRKVRYQDGIAFRIYCEEVEKTLRESREQQELAPQLSLLEDALSRLKKVTTHLLSPDDAENRNDLLDANLYLEMFGTITIAWQWLVQGPAILDGLKNGSRREQNFYQGKLAALKYFFTYELIGIHAHEKRLMNGDDLVSRTNSAYF